jgi:hypothetical protein
VDSGREQDVTKPFEVHRAPAAAAHPDVKAESEAESVNQQREPNPLIDFLSRLIIALAIYVASIGPMYWPWYQAKFLNGWWIIAALYEPLFIVAGWIPPLGRWLNWYICLWIY